MSDEDRGSMAVEPGQARLDAFSREEWEDAYNRCLLLADGWLRAFGP